MSTQVKDNVDVDVDVDAALGKSKCQHAIFLCDTCPPPEWGRIVETACKIIKRWEWSGSEERCQACLSVKMRYIERCAICGELFVNGL